MAEITLEQKTALVFIYGGDVSRPDRQVVLANSVGGDRVVIVPIMHFEFQHVENPFKDDIELLNHLVVRKVQFLQETDGHLDRAPFSNSLAFGGSASVQLLRQV